jgi:hypothetical protein
MGGIPPECKKSYRKQLATVLVCTLNLKERKISKGKEIRKKNKTKEILNRKNLLKLIKISFLK